MFLKSALLGLLAAAAMAVFPAASAATIAPKLVIEQGAGTTAGSTTATGFNIDFKTLGADSVRDLVVALPPGFMINLQTAGGACLATTTPVPSCRLGGGTINGPGGPPLALYLVAPPKISDVAGVAFVVEGGETRIGDVTLETSPALSLTLSFRFLAPATTQLQFTLSSPRLPTRCGPELEVAVAAASWQGLSGSTTAPLTVTGCSALPYAPTVAATVTKRVGEEAVVTLSFSQQLGESSTSSVAFGLPTGTKLNRILLPCLEGTKCTIGSVSASSPLLPASALANGTLILSGSVSGPALNAPLAGVSLTSEFPAPYPFKLVGPVNLSEKTITIPNMPDVPLTNLTLAFSGSSNGAPFTTSCAPGTILTRFTPQNGNATNVATTPITNVGCPPPRPRASASLTGLASGSPRLRLRVAHAAGSPDVSSVSIALPGGLRFQRGVLAARPVPGLSVFGAHVHLGGAHLRGGKLVVTFRRGTAAATIVLRPPLIRESQALQQRARRGRGVRHRAIVRIIDALGKATQLSV